MLNIQSQMKELFGNSCYAYCMGYMQGLRDIKDLTRFVLQAWYDGYIKDDGYVEFPQKIMKCKDVRHVKYKPSAVPQIVCWKYNGGTHFVVMQHDKVVFDPSGDSNTCKYGKIDTAREFIF